MRGGASRDWWKFGRWAGPGGGIGRKQEDKRQRNGGGGGFEEVSNKRVLVVPCMFAGMLVPHVVGLFVVGCGPALGENQWLQR